MTSHHPEHEQKPLRVDAQRNRARILAAADEIFAAGGPSASTDDVARRAGVAVGTVFRHFPTKAALVEAVFTSRLRRFTRAAEESLVARDAEAAFFTFFTEAVQQSATKHLFTDALADDDEVTRTVRAVIADASRVLHESMGRLLTRAQRAGAVRDDVTVTELVGLMVGAARAVEHVAPNAEAQARVVMVVGDGLRRTG